MICGACGGESPAEAAFCGHCGASLKAVPAEITCPGCGHPNDAALKFCTACGTRLLSDATRAPPASVSSGGQPSMPAAHIDRNRLPTSFVGGRYQVKRFLGEGAKKLVYLVHDSNLGRDVAFALLKTEALDPDSLARLRREAQAMARLGDHPNIITVHDIDDEGGRPYIVSQYMPGGSVADMLAKNGGSHLPMEDALSISTQIAEALAYAHQRGVVHRDLKPGNVWLAEDGSAKLGDFGLAVSRDRTRLTLEGLMVGTVAYMPPEQAAGREADGRSDLYSLGAMLYEMVTGRPPFVGEDTVSVISQHLNTPPVTPSWHNDEVSPALESLIMQLLAKDPEDRPASGAAVRERLEQIARTPLQHSTVTVTPTYTLSRLASGVFVGREAELATLKNAVEGALGGQGSPVLIVGEQGIGKTRLAEEAGVYARLRGAQFLSGRCYDGDGVPAFWPWIQIIRSYVSDHEPTVLMSEMGPGAGDIAQIVSDVRERLPGLPAPPSLEPDQARFRLFDAVTSFLRNAGARQPLVLLIDDLHWADKPSLLLLQFLARELRRSRILVIGTYRDIELDAGHALADALGSLRRERLFERILLRGLNTEAVTDLVSAWAQQDLADEGLLLAGNLHRATEGNPFFIEEILRNLIETGRLHRRGGRWGTDLTDLDFGAGFAEGVREIIGRRLARLSADCNDVLTVAAVIGREFSSDALQTMVDVSEERLLDVLEEAAAAGIIRESQSVVGRYSFSRWLIRQSLYDQLSVTRRARLHHRLAVALEELYAGNADGHLAILAHHFFAGGREADVAKAIDYSRRAGTRAISQLAYEEAVEHYRRALSALESMPLDDSLRCELLLGLGDAQWRAGDAAAARDTCRTAAGLARRLGAGELLASAALGYGCGLGGYGFTDRHDQTLVGLLEDSLDALGDRDDALSVRVLSRLALELYYTHQTERRAALSLRAVEMAQRLRDPEAQLVALYSRAQCLWGPETLTERTAAVGDILRLAEQVGDREMLFRGHAFRMANRLETGDVSGAEQEIAACAQLSAELRQPLYLWQTTGFKAMSALLAGSASDAQALIDEALAAGEAAQSTLAPVVYGAQSLVLSTGLGTLGAFEAGVRDFANQYRASAWQAAVGFILSETDQRQATAEVFEALAAEDFADQRRDGGWLLAMWLLSITCGYLGDRQRAAILYDLQKPYAERNATILAGTVCTGSVALPLGVLAACLGRYDDAIAHFETAALRHERTGAPGLVPITLGYHAAALLQRGAPGDAARAVALANRMLTTAREVGLVGYVAKALKIKLQAQGLQSDDLTTSIHAVSSAVDMERPDMRPHMAPDGTVTIMFSDIEGSTVLAESMGDTGWMEVLRAHNAIVRTELLRTGGREVKAEGDGFMIVFSSARKAIECAVEVQRRLRDLRAANPHWPVRVRMGLHVGEVVREEDDFFGRHVIVASRIASSASGNEILVSSLLRDLTGDGGFVFDDGRQLTLKGLQGTHRAYAVCWDETAGV